MRKRLKWGEMKFHETAMRGRFPTSTNRVIWHFKSRKKSSRWPFLIFHECHNYLTTHHSKMVRYDTVQYTRRLSVCNTNVCWLGVDLSSSMWINNVDLHKVWYIFYTDRVPHQLLPWSEIAQVLKIDPSHFP